MRTSTLVILAMLAAMRPAWGAPAQCPGMTEQDGQTAVHLYGTSVDGRH